MKIIISFFLFLLCIKPVFAIYDPLSAPNNRYGIHIVDTNDIAELPPLVGEWGYVTMVLSDADRDHDRWQNIFNQMRRLHLIPIIRLATHVQAGTWVRPQKDRFYEIVNLLHALNWPTENRYVILYNEPNHANEWGGEIQPEDYGQTLVDFAKQLHSASKDFFVLPAGLDASSADDEADFLTRMVAANPEVFSVIDGWTSHSYPNPGFSGSPYARGRGTLSTFDWELSYLRSLGLTKNLPVFITETGWERGALTADQVAENFRIAATSIWTDPRIAAVTPFIYKYLGTPFDRFSWKTMDNTGFYPQYYAYQQITKLPGQPKQHESYTLMSDLLPAKLIAGSGYTLSAIIENTGQGILDPVGYRLNFDGLVPTLEPNAKDTLTIRLQTPQTTGPLPLTISLTHNDETILLQTRTVQIVPPPNITIAAHLGWRSINDAPHVRVLLYDNNTLLQKFSNLSMHNGTITIDRVNNIIPGLPYRIVILVPGYLPRQVISPIAETKTIVYPRRFLPLDFDGDGTFTANDLVSLVRQSPWRAIRRFFGP